ncbi:hypothetical protein HDU98_000234 [Podochytrium sp. JEL0797]|nr:hypothetical protein HDU98_000234 [Podochytrium sp. JEL0797]
MSDDPYFLVKEEIETALASTSQLSINARRLLSSPTSSDTELQWTLSELRRLIATLSDDLADITDAVRAVSQNPSRFGIDAQEVARRKEFVETTRRAVDALKALVQEKKAAPKSRSTSNQPPTASLGEKQKDSDRNQLMRGNSASKNKNSAANGTANNDNFIDRESNMQQILMKEQDQQLDGVVSTVNNMKEIAIVMNQELDDQTALLHDLDVQVDTTQGKLDMGLKRLKTFIDANSDTKQQWTICCLVIALVVLLVIVFSM